MPRKRVLLASPNHWHSAFQVGSHNLARAFVRAGWDVAYVSDPVSPLHLAGGLTPDLRHRLSLWRAGGETHQDGRLWACVPGALLTPHRWPLLRSEWIHRHWHHWTLPNVVTQARRHGFGRVDLLYLDSLYQPFWLDALEYDRAVYRVADYNPHHVKYVPATRRLEEDMARRVDLVLYPSGQLRGYAEGLGARRSVLLPNGVDLEHFSRPAPKPPLEYRSIPGPVAVYVGVIPGWFNFAWVAQAARELPHLTFVLIGPEGLARQRLAGLANVRVLGCRPYDQVPAYLQHAQVGMMPFDMEAHPEAVAALNPQKLYAYLASGLSVVSASWAEIRALRPPARLCESGDDFVIGLREALACPADPQPLRAYAARHGWGQRLNDLLALLDDQPSQLSA